MSQAPRIRLLRAGFASDMKIFDIRDDAGRIFAFEVENVALGRRGLCRLLRRIPGVRLLQAPKLFSLFKQETFCVFSLEGATFAALEPFGGHSRYWVGPQPIGYSPQIDTIRAAFQAHTPFLERSLLPRSGET